MATFAIATFLSLLVQSCGEKNGFINIKYSPTLHTMSINLADYVGETSQYSKTDVLFVIDDSGSMSAWQTAVKDGTAQFMNKFSVLPGMNAKFGLISTHTGRAPLEGFVKSLSTEDADLIPRFQAAVAALGIANGPTERMYSSVMKVLTDYAGFLRSDAKFAIVTITDAPEQSNTSGTYFPNTDTGEFLQFLTEKKSSLENVAAYGAFGPSPECTRTDDLWSWEGSVYQSFITTLKGMWYPICTPGFGDKLAGLADGFIQKSYHLSIHLDQQAVPNTVSIEDESGKLIDPSYYEVSADGWDITFKRFDFVTPNTKVKITFEKQ